MKKLLLFTFLFILSCNSTQPLKRSDLIFKGPISSNQNPKLVSNENRLTYDSLNFIVVRGKYISGTRHVEIVEDKNTRLYYWKQFHPNGKIKEEGTMTQYNRICIGKWKFYSENGELDSITDYDKKLRVSYFKALKIAETHGYEMPNLEVDLIRNEGKLNWEFTKWVDKNGSGKGYRIFVDTKKGNVSKPDSILERHF